MRILVGWSLSLHQRRECHLCFRLQDVSRKSDEIEKLQRKIDQLEKHRRQVCLGAICAPLWADRTLHHAKTHPHLVFHSQHSRQMQESYAAFSSSENQNSYVEYLQQGVLLFPQLGKRNGILSQCTASSELERGCEF